MAVFVGVLPWSLRNSIINGRPSFVSCNGPWNFFQANNPVYDGNAIPDFEQYKDIYQPPMFQKGETHDAWIQRMGREGRRFFFHHLPYEITVLIPARLRNLLSFCKYETWPWDFTSPGSLRQYPFGPFLYIPLVPWTVIGVLGLLSLFVTDGSKRYWYLLLLWFLIIAPISVVHVKTRYRLPSDPVVVIAASAVLGYLIRSHFLQKLRFVTLFALAIILLGSAINTIRFGGPNILEISNLWQMTDEGRIAVESKLILTDRDLNCNLGEVTVDPKKAPQLLLRYEYQVELAKRMLPKVFDTQCKFYGPNVVETFFDDRGVTITVPFRGLGVLNGQHQLHLYQERGGTAWRIINIPPLAKRMSLVLRDDLYESTVTVKKLSLHAPVWFYKLLQN